MRQKKRVINFILAVVCCVCLFLGSGVVSSAAEPAGGTFEYNGNTYIYDYLNYFHTGLSYVSYSENVFSCVVGYGNTIQVYSIGLNSYTCSDKNFTWQSVEFAVDDNTLYAFETNMSFGTIEGCNVNWVSNNADVQGVLHAFSDYFLNVVYPELTEFKPDFRNYYHEDTDRWIKDLRAGVEDNVLYATWNGLDGKGLHVLEGYENIFVKFNLQFIDDKGTSSIADDEYTSMYDFYTELSKNEFSIELDSFDVPEGYRLWAMYAAPYWYFNDDVNSTMFKGKLSYMFFDENGASDYPLIKDTEDIYNPLDPNLSNWNAITNFTGDYFYNMGNVMNDTFNNWDGSNMGNDNERLNNSLSSFVQEEDAIFDSISNRLNGFEFDNYLSFGDKVTAGISFGSMLINKFFEVSGDFTILFVVGCVMVFVSIVVGIWRFK